MFPKLGGLLIDLSPQQTYVSPRRRSALTTHHDEAD